MLNLVCDPKLTRCAVLAVALLALPFPLHAAADSPFDIRAVSSGSTIEVRARFLPKSLNPVQIGIRRIRIPPPTGGCSTSKQWGSLARWWTAHFLKSAESVSFRNLRWSRVPRRIDSDVFIRQDGVWRRLSAILLDSQIARPVGPNPPNWCNAATQRAWYRLRPGWCAFAKVFASRSAARGAALSLPAVCKK